MFICDNNCEGCGKWTSVHSNGNKYTEYHCILTDKYVRIIYDEKGKEEKREVF